MRISFLQTDIIQAEITEIENDISSGFNIVALFVREYKKKNEMFFCVNKAFVSFYWPIARK